VRLQRARRTEVTEQAENPVHEEHDVAQLRAGGGARRGERKGGWNYGWGAEGESR